MKKSKFIKELKFLLANNQILYSEDGKIYILNKAGEVETCGDAVKYIEGHT